MNDNPLDAMWQYGVLTESVLDLAANTHYTVEAMRRQVLDHIDEHNDVKQEDVLKLRRIGLIEKVCHALEELHAALEALDKHDAEDVELN